MPLARLIADDPPLALLILDHQLLKLSLELVFCDGASVVFSF